MNGHDEAPTAVMGEPHGLAIWRELLEYATDAIVLSTGGRRRIVEAGAALCALSGYLRSELVTLTLGDLGLDVHGATRAAAQNGSPLRATLRRKDGGARAVELSHTPVLDGRLLVTIVRDAGDPGRPDPAAILSGAGEAILAVTGAGVVCECNAAGEQLFGVHSATILGTPFAGLFAAEHGDAVAGVVQRAVDAPGSPQHTAVTADAEDRRRVELTVTRIRTGDPRRPVLAVVARELRADGPLEDDLRYRADHDPLTGVFNRARFREELDRELARAQRQGTAGAVLALDLDHFKDVNDTLGHGRGDALLVEAATALRRRLRATDVLGRFGGDEFTVLLPATSAARAQHVAMQLIEALEAITVELPGTARPVSASIGVAPYLAGSGVVADDLLAQADIALYQAKDAGRHCTRIVLADDPPAVRAPVRPGWERRIRRALEHEDGFVLHEQPLLALRDGLPERTELLLRMRDEDSAELVPPSAFLHVAERTRLIHEIDRWVLRRAVALLADAQRAGRHLRLAVNVSTSSVSDAALPQEVGRLLAAAGADGHGLCFEITEAAAIVNLDRARAFAVAVAALGCEVALDDFGASFASFHYLKHLPVDLVKIDGRFIADLPRSPTDRMIVQAIARIATGLGKHTVAEWVGDHEAMQLLRAYGVDYAQGYHISSPRPSSPPGRVGRV